MADNRYFPGSTVSRWLPTEGRSWDSEVYQSGKPVLDAELNLAQAVGQQISRLVAQREIPSGFLRGPSPVDPMADFAFPAPGDPGFTADGFYMRRRTAVVAGLPVVVEFTGTTTDGTNLIQLDPAPVNGGTPPDVKRTDFVFLEVFRALVSPSPRASGTIEVIDAAPTQALDFGTIAPAVTVSLTAGTGLPGTNTYNAAAGTTNGVAASIRDAINDPTNAFAAYVSAEIDITNPSQVNVRASDTYAGAAGNNVRFNETSGGSEFTLNPLGGALTGGADTPNKPTQTTLYRHGNVDAPAGVNPTDDLEDAQVGAETAKRVQIQYRVRKTGSSEAINFKTDDGFTSGTVEAQGTQVSPVSRYRFVPADGQTVLGYIEVTGVGAIVAGDTITVDGTVLTAVSGAPGPAEFDIASGVPATIAASINAAILASVPTVSPTLGGSLITLEPATSGDGLTLSDDLTTVSSIYTGISSAVAYGTVDYGLWIAGDGTEKASTDLGTVDGFVYATPMAFVFRRNNASGTGGFDPLNNTNGALAHDHVGFTNTHGIGTIPAGTSDRPDQRFHDVIVEGDVLDLRKQVSPGGVDVKAELEAQMTALLDGNFKTWAVDGSEAAGPLGGGLGNGSGDVSTVFLVCDEIGDTDTDRGTTIGTWDHIRRRFADQSVVERRIFPVLPTAASAANPGLYVTTPAAGWQEGMVINIDLDQLDATGLGDWTPTGSPDTVSNLWPVGTKVTDVLRVVHDDGNYNTPIASQDVEIDLVTGVGTPHVQITLAPNNLSANGGVNGAGAYDLVGTAPATGSPRRIFVELEVTYPLGSGTTFTPDETIEGDPTVTAYTGAALENDTSKRPTDFEELVAPRFREGKREIGLEYVGNDIGSGIASGTPITESVVSSTLTSLILPRRIYGSQTTTVTVTEQGSGVPTPRAIDAVNTTWGSSERTVVLQGPGLSSSQSLCTAEFFAQDPIPNFSSPGPRYQISTYYRTNAPQTAGVQASLGSPVSPLRLAPLVMSRDLWANTTSVGSVDLSFPYTNPSDQIPVNADLASGGSPDFPGEWAMASLAKISVGDFDADTGLLNLHQMVPVDPNSEFKFADPDIDPDFRGHYKLSDVSAYRPTAMAQPLSGVATHKVWFPFLARAVEDTTLFRKNEVLLVVVSRYARLDGDNVVRFTDSDNETCAAVYRTRGLLLLASE